MTEAEALQHLRDALGGSYAGAVDDPTLKRALGVDKVGEVFRPWATAARLITDNTEYEVTDKLAARIDRKLAQLAATQDRFDAEAGILVPGSEDIGFARGGSIPTKVVW